MSRVEQMKKTLCGLFGTLSGLLGLVALLNVFYNLDGVGGIREAASGSRTETALAVLLFAAVTFAAFWLSYSLWGRTVVPPK
jgi:hypothetical protein